MGLKTAACWLGKKWVVRTKALGEGVERIVSFDQDLVIENNLEEVDVVERPSQKNEHYTIVEIEASSENKLSERSLNKTKEELASIYRNSLRSDEMTLIVNNDPLSFKDYVILNAPYVKNPDGPSFLWKKEIDFPFILYSVRMNAPFARQVSGLVAYLSPHFSTKALFAG